MRPFVNEVGDRVYRLGTRWANFYLVVEGEEAVLVDTGYPRYLRHLRAATQELGVGLQGIAP